MDAKSFVTFDFAEQQKIDDVSDADELIEGRQLAEKIVCAFPREFNATLSRQSFYGWRIDFELPPKGRAYAILQREKKWLMIVEVRSGWFERRQNVELRCAAAINSVKQILQQVKNITNTRWTTRGAFDTDLI